MTLHRTLLLLLPGAACRCPPRCNRGMAWRCVVWCLVAAMALCAVGAVQVPQAGQRHVHLRPGHASAVSWWPADWVALQGWLLQRRLQLQQVQARGLFVAHVGHDDGAPHSHSGVEQHRHAWSDASVMAVDDGGDDGASGDRSGGAALERLLGSTADLAQALRRDLSQPPPRGNTPLIMSWVADRLDRPPDR